MKNFEAIECFVHRAPATASNLVSTGDSLINYNTVIAEWYNKDTVLVNTTKYSSTTSAIQNNLRYCLEDADVIVYEFNDIPIETKSLKDYYNRMTYDEMED